MATSRSLHLPGARPLAENVFLFLPASPLIVNALTALAPFFLSVASARTDAFSESVNVTVVPLCLHFFDLLLQNVDGFTLSLVIAGGVVSFGAFGSMTVTLPAMPTPPLSPCCSQ